MNNMVEQINELKIREVMEYYGTDFNRNGFAKCPFHREKTASVSIKRNRFKCFGCGVGGDGISFVMQLYGISFSQALIRINNDFNLGLTNIKPSYRKQRELILTKKVEAAYKDHLLKNEESYKKMTDVYRILWKVSLRHKIDGLPEFLAKLEDWLDENITRKEVWNG